MDVHVQQTILLTLDENEASWLKDVMQNPVLTGGDVEDLRSADMRRRFFDAIVKAESGQAKRAPATLMDRVPNG